MTQPLGIYVSIPFCRAKCTFCNFASGAFPPARIDSYVDRLVREIESARATHPHLPTTADTVFFGGGTPSLLTPAQLTRILHALSANFGIHPGAEITLEAAPGQLADDLLTSAQTQGINRISLGVQSFNDEESRAVGRLHTAAQCLAELDRLRAAGIPRLSLDLIAGLPHQTEDSFQHSLHTAIGTGVEHISVYMLELDDDSRLGAEVLQQQAALAQQRKHTSQLAVLGQHARYHAASVPDSDRIATLYSNACRTLNAAGLQQYEISNFGRPSLHNLKYWHRDPYIGFGLDAHSMLHTPTGPVRFANPDELDTYLADPATLTPEPLTPTEAFEESIFLGLRLTRGIGLQHLREAHGNAPVNALLQRAKPLLKANFLTLTGDHFTGKPDRLRLTPQGRAISSTVFGELLA